MDGVGDWFVVSSSDRIILKRKINYGKFKKNIYAQVKVRLGVFIRLSMILNTFIG